MTESDIPESWAITSLDVIADRVGGGTPSRANLEYFQGGNIPWITVADIPKLQSQIFTISAAREYITERAVVESATHKIPPGSVILATRVSVGKVGIAGVELCTNQDFSSFTNLKIENRFLANFLFYIQPKILQQAKGTTIKGISIPTLNEIKIPLPPLPEQHRIVTKIESTFNQLEAIEQAMLAAESLCVRYRNSFLNKAFRGELVPQDSKDEPASKLLESIRVERAKAQTGKKKKDELLLISEDEIPFEVPVGWAILRISDIASAAPNSTSIGPFGSNLKVSDYRDEGVPLVFVRNVRSKKFGGIYTKYVTEEKAKELSSHSVEGGDVLVTKMGDPPGDACIYPIEQPVGIITADCIKIKVDRRLILPEFLEALVNSPIVKPQIAKMTQGAAQQKMSLERFRSLLIPVPPLEEQIKIMVRISRMETVLSRIELQIGPIKTFLNKSKDSLLRAAFSGKLVHQRPDEGTGQELLKIILETGSSDLQNTRSVKGHFPTQKTRKKK